MLKVKLISMNRDDVLPLVRSTKDDEMYKQLREALRQMDEVELFHGLYWVAVETPYQTPSFPIYYAGNLLFDLNPTCQISCEEAVRAMLSPGWDISLEEVPWYLYKQFGIAPIHEAVERIRPEPLSNEERVRLDTVKYWADTIHKEGIEINEKWRI